MAQNDSPSRPPDDPRKLQRDYVRYSGMGIEFALTVGLFGLAGWWLDGKLGITQGFPLLLLLGVFGGMGLGIYRMRRTLEAMPGSSRWNMEDHDEEKDPPS